MGNGTRIVMGTLGFAWMIFGSFVADRVATLADASQPIAEIAIGCMLVTGAIMVIFALTLSRPDAMELRRRRMERMRRR